MNITNNEANPFVTVFMPVYNGEKYLREAVDSVIKQTYTNFELLIINDGSTDNSEDIIKSFTDNRIRYIKNESNLKLTKTRNKGLLEAKADFIILHDCDDISLPNRIDKLVNEIKNKENIAILGSDYYVINNVSKIIQKVKMPSGQNYVLWMSFFINPIANPSCIIRRQIAIDAGMYSENMLNGSEDYDLSSKIQLISTFDNIEEPLILYRKHKHNISYCNFMAMEENTYKISQFIASNVLNRNVDIELIKCNRRFKYPTIQNAEDSIKLIIELRNKLISNKEPNKSETQKINIDAARRIFIIICLKFYSIKVLKYLKKLFSLDKLVLIRTLIFITNRIIRKLREFLLMRK